MNAFFQTRNPDKVECRTKDLDFAWDDGKEAACN
jgi:hypothetical protein